MKAYINSDTELMDNLIFPCYKDKDGCLCRLRTVNTLNFPCGLKPQTCRFRKQMESKAKLDELADASMKVPSLV